MAAYNDRNSGTALRLERELKHGNAGWRARKTPKTAPSSLLPSSSYAVYGGEGSVDQRESDYMLEEAATGSSAETDS